MQYGLAQAKARLSELTHLVDAGQEVVIARHGKPEYRLVAVSALLPQSAVGGDGDKTPESLDDMAGWLTSLRSKTRAPQEPNFVAHWRDGARY